MYSDDNIKIKKKRWVKKHINNTDTDTSSDESTEDVMEIPKNKKINQTKVLIITIATIILVLLIAKYY